jgi:hypothetical protein
VKELQLLLLKNKEDRVCKLPVPFDCFVSASREPEVEVEDSLEVVVCHVQSLERGRPALVVADSVVKAIVVDGGDDLQRGISTADRRVCKDGWERDGHLPA